MNILSSMVKLTKIVAHFSWNFADSLPERQCITLWAIVRRLCGFDGLFLAMSCAVQKFRGKEIRNAKSKSRLDEIISRCGKNAGKKEYWRLLEWKDSGLRKPKQTRSWGGNARAYAHVPASNYRFKFMQMTAEYCHETLIIIKSITFRLFSTKNNGSAMKNKEDTSHRSYRIRGAHF